RLAFLIVLSLFPFSLSCSFLFLVLRRPPRSPLFPYTTLFRSSTCPPTAPSARSRSTRRRSICSRTRCAPRCSTPSPTSEPGACADRKSTRLNSSHEWISYAVFCLKKKKQHNTEERSERAQSCT